MTENENTQHYRKEKRENYRLKIGVRALHTTFWGGMGEDFIYKEGKKNSKGKIRRELDFQHHVVSNINGYRKVRQRGV